MKTKINLLLGVMLFIGITASAQDSKTEEFKVYGNCGMCKTRIEKAAKTIDGVSMAEWDKTTKMAKVSFDAGKTNVLEIQKAIAKVGHDTDKYKADDKVYEKLPGCCLYDRPVTKDKMDIK
ncbi:MAG: ATPase [Bacteroidetes bacterium HGW-Bacteroidetes-17]|jgi:copper chaperone CopZ|nr:MAG: ATPase [Bacteroidetes bacterium HGW-Bacteroidetes-17]